MEKKKAEPSPNAAEEKKNGGTNISGRIEVSVGRRPPGFENRQRGAKA